MQCNHIQTENHTVLMMYHMQTEVLDLSDNNIVQISDYAFEDLVNVYELDLSGNKLSTLSADAMWGLINLMFLRLDFNEITVVDTEFFQYLTNHGCLSPCYSAHH